MTNDDLIGKTYRNGDGGSLYRVLRVCRQDNSFVAAVSLDGQIAATALADFVRSWLVEAPDEAT